MSDLSAQTKMAAIFVPQTIPSLRIKLNLSAHAFIAPVKRNSRLARELRHPFFTQVGVAMRSDKL